MASRRLIDLYAIANASAAIVRKHVLIRTHQLNHYGATTSIGKALNGRVSPQFTTLAGTVLPGTPIDGRHRVRKEGTDQDHRYTPGEGSIKHPKPENDLIIDQKPTEGVPLPDGTVNPADISAASTRSYKDGFEQDVDYIPGNGHPKPTTDQKVTQEASDGTINPVGTPASGGRPSPKQLQHQYETTIPSETADPPTMPETRNDVLGQEEVNAEKLTEVINADVFYPRSSSVLSNLPRVKIPTASVGEQPILGERINAEEYSQRLGEKEELPTTVQDEASVDEISTQVFRSRRARGMFGRKTDSKKSSAPAPKAVDEEHMKRVVEEEHRAESIPEIAAKVVHKLPPEIKAAQDDIEELPADISQDVQRTAEIQVWQLSQ
jgi:aarF domain-containing kinase